MTNGPARWLLDTCLPRSGYEGIDAVHASCLSRIPGPAGLREACELNRALVTCADEFRGAFRLPLDHPGVVVLEGPPVDGPEVVRNLRHVEFRIWQYGEALGLAGNRFHVRTDRQVFRILPDGSEVELEPWRHVQLQMTPAAAV